MIDYNSGTTPDLPMKWHKFISYFALWAGALYNLGQAGLFMSGQHYGSESQRDLVYQVYDGLKTVDMIGALGYAFVAIFAIYTAIQLIKLKQNAPKKLMALYIITTAVPIIYILMASSSTGMPTADLVDNSIYTSVAGCAFGLIVCKIYYDKRAHMFVN